MPSRLSQEIAPHLPYLRRYSRALTGSQQSGDAHVKACLEAIVSDPGILDLTDGARVGLYRLFHAMRVGLTTDTLDTSASSAGLEVAEQTAQDRLAAMPQDGRQVLLLSTMEGFDAADVSRITGHSEAEVRALVNGAAPSPVVPVQPAARFERCPTDQPGGMA